MSDIRQLREQIKAKRPDWSDEQIDQATKKIYMQNPNIIKKSDIPQEKGAMSDSDINQLKPGESMMINAPEMEQPQPQAPSLKDKISSGFDRLSAIATPQAEGSAFPNEQAKIDAIKRIQSMNSPKLPSPATDELQDSLNKAFKFR